MCYILFFLGPNVNYPLWIITAIFLFSHCQSKLLGWHAFYGQQRLVVRFVGGQKSGHFYLKFTSCFCLHSNSQDFMCHQIYCWESNSNLILIKSYSNYIQKNSKQLSLLLPARQPMKQQITLDGAACSLLAFIFVLNLKMWSCVGILGFRT